MSDAPPPPPDTPPFPPPLPPPATEAQPVPPPAPPPDLTVVQPPPFMPVPPADSQFATDRKSSNILLYVGIGCGLLALIALVVVVLGVGWGVRKVAEIGANPEKFAAEMIVKSDPNLEQVSTDEIKGEITVRNKTTGETKTATFKEAAEGKLTHGGVVVFTDKDQAATTTTQPAGWPGAPAWFPVMEGLVTGPAEVRSTTDAREALHLTATGAASTEEIVAFYSDSLDTLGFTISREAQSAGSLVNERIEAADDAGKRHVTINVTRVTPDAPAGIVVTIDAPAAP